MAITERPCGSFVRGVLPEGCRLCERGGKMVLFVTGLCSFHCSYCPVSDEKMYRDVVYADELRVERDEDVLAEARAIRATGAGITGGDPFEAIDRTCRYIRMLKAEFGPSFHTHLYTMSTDPEKIRLLAEAGLDELRFHPPPGLWSRMDESAYVTAVRVARELGVTVGIEVPLIPERTEDLRRLIDWAGQEGLAFVNLNELELSDANYGRMKILGYAAKGELSHGVRGADEAAQDILSRRWNTTVHYCTSRYKDAWQLRERIRRRAEQIRRPWDVLTEDGTLLKGIIEAEDPEGIERELRERFHVPQDLFGRSGQREVEVAPWILEEIAADIDAPCFVVERYPTADGLEVERARLP